MRATRRVIKDVACGNNCTGAYYFPSLWFWVGGAFRSNFANSLRYFGSSSIHRFASYARGGASNPSSDRVLPGIHHAKLVPLSSYWLSFYPLLSFPLSPLSTWRPTYPSKEWLVSGIANNPFYLPFVIILFCGMSHSPTDFAEALPHDLFLALRRLQHHSSFHDLSISISRQGGDQGMDQEDDQDEDQEVDDCLVSVAFSSMSFWEETAVSNASACTSFSQ